MTAKQVLEKANINFVEKRTLSDEYCEVVIVKRDLALLNQVLTGLIEAAVKPEGMQPTHEQSTLTKGFGGINSNQVLYKKEFANTVVIAMLWPWSDGMHITVKIISQKK